MLLQGTWDLTFGYGRIDTLRVHAVTDDAARACRWWGVYTDSDYGCGGLLRLDSVDLGAVDRTDRRDVRHDFRANHLYSASQPEFGESQRDPQGAMDGRLGRADS